jgi:hypothetical protein
MKTNFFRATAMAVAVLFAGGVAAQNNESINAQDSTIVGQGQVINNLKGEVRYDFTGTAKEAYQFLKDNQADTLITSPIEVFSDTTVMVQGQPMTVFAGDTLYVHLKYNLDGPRAIHRDTLWVLNAHEEEIIPVMSNLERKVARLAKETAVVDKVNAGRERDRYGYRVTFDNGNTYTITDKAQNKYGWKVGPYVGLQAGSHLTGFLAGGELAYSNPLIEGTLSVGAAHNKYTDNAEENVAGTKMWSLDSRAMGWFNLSSLWGDKYGVNRVLIGGGAGEMFYETKSREVENPDGSVDLVQSRGSAFYLVGGIKYEHRFFNKGQNLSVGLYIAQNPNVWQDLGQQNHFRFEVRAAWTFNCWGNKVNNHK